MQGAKGVLFLTVFLDLLGFGMVLPLMPLYAADPRFNATPTQIGWLMASYSLMQFLLAPLWGGLSDRYGRRPVLLIGLFGSSLSYLIYGLGNSLSVLFWARAAAGAMGANIAAAQAVMADITSSEDRAKGMGLIGAAFSLGFVLGPTMGGLLSQFGLAWAPLTAALITGLNGIAAIFFLPETRQSVGKSHRFNPFSLALWHDVGHSPAAYRICWLMGLFITLFASFEVTLPLWGQERLAWTITTSGWVFAYVGLIMSLVQGGLIRRIVPRLGEIRMALLGLTLIAAGLSLLNALGGDGGLLLALALVASGAGLVHPALSALVSLNAPAERQGMMMGLFQAMSALGRIIGPVVGGFSFSVVHGGLFLWVATGLGGVLVLLTLIRGQMLDSLVLKRP